MATGQENEEGSKSGTGLPAHIPRPEGSDSKAAALLRTWQEPEQPDLGLRWMPVGCAIKHDMPHKLRPLPSPKVQHCWLHVLPGIQPAQGPRTCTRGLHAPQVRSVLGALVSPHFLVYILVM